MKATHYEIRIRGRLGEALKPAFEGLTATTSPAETVLSGEIVDQARLHGVLERIQSLGLELVEVRRIVHPDLPGGGSTCHPC